MGSILQGLGNAVDKVQEFFSFIDDVFLDVDFSVLWSWIPLPADISAVLVCMMFLVLVLAGFGFVKKLIVIFG